MELLEYARVLWRRKWVFVITVIVAIVVIIAGVSRLTPVYQTSTTLRFMTTTSGNPDYTEYDVDYADRLMNTYARIATSSPVLDELRSLFDIADLPSIVVTVIPNTELMTITTEHPDPVLAVNVADALAQILVDRSKEAYVGLPQAGAQEAGPEQNGAFVSIVEPAKLPVKPSKPNKPLYMALGALVSVVGGAGLAFFFEATDTRLRTVEQIEAAVDIPVIGEIPVARVRHRTGSLLKSAPYAESLSRLKAHIAAIIAETSLKVLAVTSAEPEEGKSIITADLAVSVGQTGQPVVVIDADMRRPNLHKIFQTDNGLGLSNLLHGGFHYPDVIKKTMYPNVFLITSGPEPINSPGLLGSANIKALLDDLSPKFAMVLIDTPAFLAVSDTAVIAPEAEGLILVVRRSQIKREILLETVRLLAQLNVKPIGIVLNRARLKSDRYYKHHRLTPAADKDAARAVESETQDKALSPSVIGAPRKSVE